MNTGTENQTDPQFFEQIKRSKNAIWLLSIVSSFLFGVFVSFWMVFETETTFKFAAQSSSHIVNLLVGVSFCGISCLNWIYNREFGFAGFVFSVLGIILINSSNYDPSFDFVRLAPYTFFFGGLGVLLLGVGVWLLFQRESIGVSGAVVFAVGFLSLAMTVVKTATVGDKGGTVEPSAIFENERSLIYGQAEKFKEANAAIRALREKEEQKK